MYSVQAGRRNRLGHNQKTRRISPPVDSYATSTSRFGPSEDGFGFPNLPEPSLPKLPKLPSGFGPPTDSYDPVEEYVTSSIGYEEEESGIDFFTVSIIVLAIGKSNF